MNKIVLTTLNARYTHSAIGLRYLYANLEEFQENTSIVEFTINEAIQTIAEKILMHNPSIIGIGVYIWNATEVKELIEILKKVSPETTIVLGGPEVSYRPFRVDFSNANYILQGEADLAFYKLVKDIETNCAPTEHVIRQTMPDIKKIKLPYQFYNEHDVANRYIYVEASRGCPFECEFCLSSIDEKVRNFELDNILKEFELLWEKGVRSFKFIDRTFNLNMRFANSILDFFLSKEPPYFAHFEVIPDHFPESIKQKIAQFPAGSLQLEIGIQTLNPVIAENINRPLKIKKIEENIAFLETQTKAHMHLDLIVGLPGETLESFGKNLDTLCSLSHSEIQIGILKKLSGTSIARHDEKFAMTYSDIPPYDVLKTKEVGFLEIQKMKRFARFWDLTYNSGNFKETMQIFFQGKSVFDEFYAFSEWIYTQTDATWKISLERLSALLFRYLVDVKNYHDKTIAEAMLDDIMSLQGRVVPKFLKPFHIKPTVVNANTTNNKMNKRQNAREI
jgi:radical SAM superfamily enzyme YgiQ (UPF0313 family)